MTWFREPLRMGKGGEFRGRDEVIYHEADTRGHQWAFFWVLFLGFVWGV